jgi:nucleotide-binding universal stress UspA family protein
MYTSLLIPLDGSKTAERVLPYARVLATTLKIPVELIGVIDIAEMALHVAADKVPYLETLIEDEVKNSAGYLKGIAGTFSGVSVKCTVEKGRAEEVVIERAAASKNTLITMATHGRSGLNRWLLGSVTEKVLRAASNPVLIVRAHGAAKIDGVSTLKTITVPLDGSALAESVLPGVAELAKALKTEVVLIRAFNVPAYTYAGVEDYYASNYDEMRKVFADEAREYLEKKVAELKYQGIEKVSFVPVEGHAADEIIALGRKTGDNLIAMCTHGRSGVKRWVLGSVTETVVRHADDPVLVIRAA